VIYDWLVQRSAAGEYVELPPIKEILKPELMLQVQKLKRANNNYAIDNLVQEYGHDIVRLPPYNADLNPIEFVWSNIKGKVKKNNQQQTLDYVLNITK
jgi:transposase